MAGTRVTQLMLALTTGAKGFSPASVTLLGTCKRAHVLLILDSTPLPLNQPGHDASNRHSDSGTWDERELWALEDCVPRYALDTGRLVLWERMALDVPEFATRTADELRACWLDPPITLQKGELEQAVAESPPRLEQWEQLADGSIRGVLYGVSGVRDGCVRATVEPTAATSLAEAERWCVRTRDGDVFQLGMQAEPTTSDVAIPVPERAQSAASAVVSAVGETSQMALPAVAATAATFAAPAAVAAMAVAVAIVVTGGHLHIPHLDINVFLV